MPSQLPPHDHDFDGRPPVAWHGDDDPLLELLIRWHPEHMPAELIDRLAASRRSF
jgi:hypothetical protein